MGVAQEQVKISRFQGERVTGLDIRPCCGLDALGLALEACHGLLEGTLAKFLTLYPLKLHGSEWNLHGQDLEEVLLGALVVVVVDDIEHAVPDDVGDVHTDTLAHQGVAALLVDHGTLLVHHVVVL